MVVATPCPLILAIPVAVIGAISLAARYSIIIKNPTILEQITSCRTLIFDKTGTLTYGKLVLTEIECAPSFDRDHVLRMAASVEQYSKHPLAAAILVAARVSNLTLESVSEMSEKPGEGLEGTVSGNRVKITGRGKIGEAALSLSPLTDPSE